MYDQCVFSTENNECIVLLYVDDILIFSKSSHTSGSLINYLKETYKEIKINEGIKHSYLGMELIFHNRQLKVDMQGYIENILS